jgi:hypothetical protein
MCFSWRDSCTDTCTAGPVQLDNGADPYDASETSLEKCNALDSSLWELKVSALSWMYPEFFLTLCYFSFKLLQC